MGQPTLFLMLGYPGAGKTTTAKLVSQLSGAVHLSSDSIRLELFPSPTYSQAEHDTVYQTLDERTRQHLLQGRSVIYDGNLNRYTHRAEKYTLSQQAGARPVVLWVQTPKELARTRAVLRGHHHLVPQDETFESMFDRVAGAIEEPRTDEPVHALDGTSVTQGTVGKVLQNL
jgi:predicted kinase